LQDQIDYDFIYGLANSSYNLLLTQNCFLGIYLELFLIICLSLVIIFFVTFDYKFEYKFILSTKISGILILIFLLMILLLNNDNHNYVIFSNMLVEDNLSIFIQNILLINFVLYIIISLNYIFLEKILNYEYLILLGLSFLGMITMIKSNDLISLYLAIELQSLVFYIISSFKVSSNFSTEAGLKYFILGAFSSGILLLGCSFIYGFLGTTNFYDIYMLLDTSEIPEHIFNGFSLGIVLVTISVLFKIGAAPFHM
jgi:NADH:ubiquinone oxidoreductase subunit 2 (subunit N)